jgi:hypothetical protein
VNRAWFFLSFILVGWPAYVVGYLYAMLVSGFQTGMFMHKRHEDAAVDRFIAKRDTAQGTAEGSGADK